MTQKFFGQFPSGQQYLYEAAETGVVIKRAVLGGSATFRLKEGDTVAQWKERIQKNGLMITSKRTTMPSMRTMEKWVSDGIVPTPDGCRVEPDGICEHGWRSFTYHIC